MNLGLGINMIKDAIDIKTNNLESYWMPFTSNRSFKANPRMLVAAKGMYYTSQDNRQILDGVAGLWCVNAGHCRKKIVEAVGEENCESLSDQSMSNIKSYIDQSDIYIGNDSFGHHISCQMGKPSFIILLDTPRAYSDYSVNQFRIIPPDIDLDQITHGSRKNPNTISVEKVLNKIRKFI